MISIVAAALEKSIGNTVSLKTPKIPRRVGPLFGSYSRSKSKMHEDGFSVLAPRSFPGTPDWTDRLNGTRVTLPQRHRQRRFGSVVRENVKTPPPTGIRSGSGVIVNELQNGGGSGA
jgi:hypothetical protein